MYAIFYSLRHFDIVNIIFKQKVSYLSKISKSIYENYFHNYTIQWSSLPFSYHLLQIIDRNSLKHALSNYAKHG